MKIRTVLSILALLEVAVAVPGIPRRPIVFRKRQASTCSCPSDVYLTTTSLSTITVTGSATVSTDAGNVEVTGSTNTQTTTISRTTTVTAPDQVSTTVTIGGTTRTTSAAATTVTQTSTITSTTITTCIVSAYKMKRQASDSSTVTSAPSTTTLTTNFGGSTRPPSTCVCRLVSAYSFPSATSTSPMDACSCTPISTWSTTITSAVTTTYTTINTISQYDTTTYTPQVTSTQYSDSTIITTITTTYTVSSRSVTSTQRSTVTVTTTVTPTYVSCPTADLSCDNQGLRWALYPNKNSAGVNNTNKDSTYSTFDPTVFKSRTPSYQNLTYTMGGFDYPAANPVYISFYNSTQKFYSDYIVLNHVGYVFAQVSGAYTFSVSKSDDITLMWVGANAYSGWTRANANIVNPYGAGTGTYTVNLVAGNYYPIRIVFGNAQQAIVFEATLTAPDGTVILTSNSKKSPYLVQYSCDGAAPAFPAFGSET